MQLQWCLIFVHIGKERSRRSFEGLSCPGQYSAKHCVEGEKKKKSRSKESSLVKNQPLLSDPVLNQENKGQNDLG